MFFHTYPVVMIVTTGAQFPWCIYRQRVQGASSLAAGSVNGASSLHGLKFSCDLGEKLWLRGLARLKKLHHTCMKVVLDCGTVCIMAVYDCLTGRADWTIRSSCNLKSDQKSAGACCYWFWQQVPPNRLVYTAEHTSRDQQCPDVHNGTWTIFIY